MDGTDTHTRTHTHTHSLSMSLARSSNGQVWSKHSASLALIVDAQHKLYTYEVIISEKREKFSLVCNREKK
jgi:hypothetical protein